MNKEHIICFEESKISKIATGECKRCFHFTECQERNVHNWCVIKKSYLCDYHCDRFCWKGIEKIKNENIVCLFRCENCKILKSTAEIDTNEYVLKLKTNDFIKIFICVLCKPLLDIRLCDECQRTEFDKLTIDYYLCENTKICNELKSNVLQTRERK